MRKLLTLLVAGLAVAAIGVVPAGAITKNYVPDDEHPFVGLVVFYDDEGEFMWRCSGSLLSSTVLLTAGHCTDQDADESPDSARVYFQQDAGANYDPATQIDPVSGYPDTCANGTLGTLCAMSDQLYDFGFDNFAGFPNTMDAGLVILDQAIAMPEYGVLADVGTLDGLISQPKNDNAFTVSGYGLSYSSPVGFESFRSRLMGPAKLVNVKGGLNKGFNLQTNGNGGNRAGTCGGDSGGPVFLGGASSNTIVAVTSFGLNQWCRGTDFAYRVDTTDVQDWVDGIVD
jgi:Trypsin